MRLCTESLTWMVSMLVPAGLPRDQGSCSRGVWRENLQRRWHDAVHGPDDRRAHRRSVCLHSIQYWLSRRSVCLHNDPSRLSRSAMRAAAQQSAVAA